MKTISKLCIKLQGILLVSPMHLSCALDHLCRCLSKIVHSRDLNNMKVLRIRTGQSVVQVQMIKVNIKGAYLPRIGILKPKVEFKEILSRQTSVKHLRPWATIIIIRIQWRPSRNSNHVLRRRNRGKMSLTRSPISLTTHVNSSVRNTRIQRLSIAVVSMKPSTASFVSRITRAMMTLFWLMFASQSRKKS
jgi:hypothetical protein